ncbi:MAG TPA: RNA-binding S4 domain-containing protein [Telluria sp.]|nr:RNA-binding S4 domain-containing protein [Telluria sp.]
MQKITFELRSEYVELNQLLKLAGLCDSGGAGKNLVASGVVSVDGKQELRKTAKIRAGQLIGIGDVRIGVLSPEADGA